MLDFDGKIVTVLNDSLRLFGVIFKHRAVVECLATMLVDKICAWKNVTLQA